MLEILLRRVAEAGTASSAQLAQELGVSPALLRGALDELVRHGYLQALIAGCGEPCDSCPAPAACLYTNAPRVWSLTAKGLARAAALRGGYSAPSSSFR